MAKRNGNGNGKPQAGNILGAVIGGLIGFTGGLPGLVIGSAIGYGVSSAAKKTGVLTDGNAHSRKRSSARKRSARR